MDGAEAAELARARSAVGRAQKQLRKAGQTLAAAADERGVLDHHTVTDISDVGHLADLLTAAVQTHGRIHVVVIRDDVSQPH